MQTESGTEITARFLINGSGVLTVPKLPDVAGVDSFAGINMHTARWDHLVPGGMTVQRALSQTYVEVTFPLSAQYYTVFPFAKRTEAAGKVFLRREVEDPVVRDQLTPRYAVGCKRPGFHNT